MKYFSFLLFLPFVSSYCNNVSTGLLQTLAKKDNGTVYSWGGNPFGQLGDDTFSNSYMPVQVLGINGVGILKKIIDVSGGGDFSLALVEDGTVVGFGSNYWGKLGPYGVGNWYPTPIQILANNNGDPLTNIKKISAGQYFSLFLNNNGNIYGCGQNGSGQLGLGTTSEQVITPSKIDVIQFKEIKAGYIHSLAIGIDNSCYAWGDNEYGEIGQGNTQQYNAPTKVKISGTEYLTDIEKIAAGNSFNLAIKANEQGFWAWGINNAAQCGINNSGINIYLATYVGANLNTDEYITNVACGYNHSLFLTNNFRVFAFGDNSVGQLGQPESIINSYTPLEVQGPNGAGVLSDKANIIEISAGYNFSVALADDGTIYAWGENPDDEIGVPSSLMTQSNYPIKLRNFNVYTLPTDSKAPKGMFGSGSGL